MGYDGEDRMTSFIGGQAVSYAYDGEGRRVKKVSPTETRVYVYDAQGQLAAEYGPLAAVGGQHFLTADHLGSTRLVTDADGNRTSLHDYLPFGEEIPAGLGGRTALWGATDNISQRFTAKERDSESGLDYFGARHFSGAQGRFTSPDPLLNSGRPWLPRSWNRYAYALNNPLKFTDPEGLYEWARDCAAGDEACQRERDWFRKALDRAHEAAAKFKPRSEEGKALERALARYGEENQRTGVLVAFGHVEHGLAQTEGNPAVATVTFDLDKINTAIESWKKAGWDINAGPEAAGLSVHEGIHVADQRYSGLPGIDYSQSLTTERSAFNAQSYINKAFNRPSIYLLWNPSWAAADREKLRQAAVEKAAQRAVQFEWQMPRQAR